jgi:hypothetical protein
VWGKGKAHHRHCSTTITTTTTSQSLYYLTENIPNMAGGPVIDQATVGGLSAALSLLIIAYLASLKLLPSTASTRTRVFFIWHSFDSLVHFIFEGSFLYNCFNVFLSIKDVAKHTYLSGKAPVELYPAGVHFLGFKDRIYGSAYGSSPTAMLWQEYAKADARWGGADLTVIALELLTVFIGGPLSAYICYLMAKGHGDVGAVSASGKKGMGGKLAFWMIVLATGELYGGELFRVSMQDTGLIHSQAS